MKFPWSAAVRPCLCAAAIACTLGAGLAAQDIAPYSLGPNPLPAEAAGDLLLNRGRWVEAIDAYSRAPISPIVWNKMGIAWHHLSALDEAKKDYQHALSLSPRYADAVNNLASVEFAQRYYRRAIQLYRRARQFDPGSAVIAANLGSAYFADHKLREGAEAYRAALALDPHVFENTENDPVAMVEGPSSEHDRAEKDYCLAELYAQAGDGSQALEWLRRAFGEGFSDRRHVLEDPMLAGIRAAPEFAQVLALLPQR